MRDFNPNDASQQALEELLAALRNAQVRTVVILAPQAESLRQLYHQENLARLIWRVRELCSRYGHRFVDAGDWIPDRDFADCIHPTAPGAAVFSERLANEVLSPMLNETTAAVLDSHPPEKHVRN